jgi:hypothetical protein
VLLLPLKVRPEIVTVFPEPTTSFANAPEAELVTSEIADEVSPLTTPTNDALPVLRVATVLLSKTLLLAVIPETVRTLTATVTETFVEVVAAA